MTKKIAGILISWLSLSLPGGECIIRVLEESHRGRILREWTMLVQGTWRQWRAYSAWPFYNFLYALLPTKIVEKCNPLNYFHCTIFREEGKEQIFLITLVTLCSKHLVWRVARNMYEMHAIGCFDLIWFANFFENSAYWYLEIFHNWKFLL